MGLGVGAIVSQSFTLLGRNIVALLVISVITTAIGFGVNLALFGGAAMSLGTLGDPEAAQELMLANGMGKFYVLMAIMMVVSLVLISFWFGAVTKLACDSRSGRSGNIGAALATGFARVPAIAIVFLVTIFAWYIVFGITIALIGVIAATLGTIGTLVGILLGIAVFVAAPYSAGALSLMGPAMVVEKSWFGSIGRSLSLTSGYRWPVVGLLLLLALISFALALVNAGLTLLVISLGTVGMVLSFVLSAVFSALLYGLMGIAYALAYLRLREIKEGLGNDDIAEVFD